MLREALAERLAELPIGAGLLGEHIARGRHDRVEVDAVEPTPVVAVVAELLGQDRLRERPKREAVVRGDGVHGAALDHQPDHLAVQDQRFELTGVEVGQPGPQPDVRVRRLLGLEADQVGDHVEGGQAGPLEEELPCQCRAVELSSSQDVRGHGLILTTSPGRVGHEEVAMRVQDVVRLDLGTFVRPAEETGTGQPRVEAVLGYVARTSAGLLLLDTGLGGCGRGHRGVVPPAPGHDRAGAARRRPDHRRHRRRRQLPPALRPHRREPRVRGLPIHCQRRELETARTTDYTVPELVDFAGARYELLDGEAELAPGVHVIPTPGHVDGHQSVVGLDAGAARQRRRRAST